MENEDFKIRNINEKQIHEVRELFSCCDDYFFIVEGRTANDDSLKDFFFDLPDSKKIADKYLNGVYIKQKLIGVIDILKDYPEEGVNFLGLLLLHPDNRQNGLGRKLHEWVVNESIKQHVKQLRIGVVEANTNALKFWKSLGYKDINKTEPILMGEKKSVIYVMGFNL